LVADSGKHEGEGYKEFGGSRIEIGNDSGLDNVRLVLVVKFQMTIYHEPDIIAPKYF
jgi:hypothetical protein